MPATLFWPIVVFVLCLALVGLSAYTGYAGAFMDNISTLEIDVTRIIFAGVVIVVIVLFIMPEISNMSKEAVHFSLAFITGLILFPLLLAAGVRLYGTLNYGIGISDLCCAGLLLVFSIADFVIEVQMYSAAQK